MKSYTLSCRMLLLLFSVLLAGACATAPVQTGFLARDLQYSLPAQPWTNPPLTAFQQVTIEFGDSVQHFQASVDLKPGLVKISLLDLTGARAMDINWSDDDTLEIAQASWLPPEVRGEDILTQIVLAFWPISEAKKGLPRDVTLSQSDDIREIRTGKEILISVSGDQDNPWSSKTIINHSNSPFRLTISSSLTGVSE